MKEQGYQSKIIKGIEGIGGIVINGQYSKAGTADLICGWPKNLDVLVRDGEYSEIRPRETLLHLHVEVKTEEDYHRVMRSVYTEEGLYKVRQVHKSLKKHEMLQIAKLNEVRTKGGYGLFAYSFEQVEEYMHAQE